MDRNSTGGTPIGPSTLLWMVSLSNHFVLTSRDGVDIESFLHSHAERFIVGGKPRTYVRGLGCCPYREVGTFTPFQPWRIRDVSFYHDGVGTGFIPALTPI